MNNESHWIEDNSRHWVTPGGDPVWRCEKCGKGYHVYGVENNNPEKICSNCGRSMKYPWEK